LRETERGWGEAQAHALKSADAENVGCADLLTLPGAAGFARGAFRLRPGHIFRCIFEREELYSNVTVRQLKIH